MNRFWAVPSPDGRTGYLVKVPGTHEVVSVSTISHPRVKRWGTGDELDSLVKQGVFVMISYSEAMEAVNAER